MGEHVEGGRFKRFARIASVAARTTGDLIKAEAKRRLLKTDEEQIDVMLQPTAMRLVKVLGEMKGAATKLGQFLSLVDQDTFPEEARKVLSKLLSQTPHVMPYETAGEQVVKELGAPPEELFDDFSMEPFASASMGQVHAATLKKSGRKVVVKIQFPGVEKSIASDLKNIGLLAKGLSLAGGTFDGRQYVDEIEEMLRIELDYHREAAQLAEYREAVRPWPKLYVPDVIEEFSAKRVITLERLEGPTMLEFSHDETKTEAERYQIACRLIEALWGPFLSKRLIHADPHPGNYIVLGDGRLGVLDFGATKTLSVPFALAYWRLTKLALQGERPEVIPHLLNAGFTFIGKTEPMEVWLRDFADIIERPLRRDYYDWEACQMTIDARDLIAKNMVTALRAKGPKESVMFYRAAAGAGGDFRLLKAKGDFHQPLRELVHVAEQNLDPALLEADPELFREPLPLKR